MTVVARCTFLRLRSQAKSGLSLTSFKANKQEKNLCAESYFVTCLDEISMLLEATINPRIYKNTRDFFFN